MSAEELVAQIAAKKVELAEVQARKKDIEREFQGQLKDMVAEKDELSAGIDARMDVIQMLKRDILRMAYEESLRIADQEFEQPPPAKP